jgi:peptide-methionine (S)-S-oxide reductase
VLRRRRRWIVLGLAAAAVVLVAILWLLPPDPVGELRAHAPQPIAFGESPAPDLGPRITRWWIPTADGETLFALWRAAPAVLPEAGADASRTAHRPWTIVLLGGLETGDRAALLIPEGLPVNVLSMDWPWRRPRTMGTAEFLRSIPAIRRAILRSPGTLAAGVRLAASRAEVDSQRIALVGASLGVPTTVAALRLTAVPHACVLLHGGADLRAMLRHALGEHTPRGIDAIAAAIGARVIRPLEPRLHAPHLQQVPMLVVNATDDDKLPEQAVDALHRAFPHAEVRWQSGRHLRPQNDTLIDSLSIGILEWLEGLEANAGRERHGSDLDGWREPRPTNDAATMLPSRGEAAPWQAGEEACMSDREIATLAGGCFWCLEAVFLELRGVESVQSGYAGGRVSDPSYEQVCSGKTGHAEVVQVTFDPAVLSFRELLEVFFTIHDPTTRDRQGADVGTQYRSAIFVHSPEQRATAQEVIASFDAESLWGAPIVTEVTPFEVFYPAEEYHQDYFARNPTQPYCQVVVAPKVAKVRSKFIDKLRR